jgi:hypothetical protein
MTNPQDIRCPYCGLGSITKKDCKDLSEQCDTAYPCFVCGGTGMKDSSRYHHYIKNVKVKEVGDLRLDRDTYCPKRRIAVEFDLCEEGQQDGRPSPQYWIDAIKAIHLGKAVLADLPGAVQKKVMKEHEDQRTHQETDGGRPERGA